jgi:hypothetical protein
LSPRRAGKATTDFIRLDAARRFRRASASFLGFLARALGAYVEARDLAVCVTIYEHGVMNDDDRRRWWTSNKEVSPPVIALLAAFGLFGIFAIAISVFDSLMMVLR